MNARRKPVVFVVVLVVVALAGCEDKKEQLLRATTAADAGMPIATPSATTPPSPSSSTTPAPATTEDAKRFDPNHKCPTGQTHFYLEGDFCRRKCFTNADCAKKERCSLIEYPFVLDGGTAGMAKFCEGT